MKRFLENSKINWLYLLDIVVVTMSFLITNRRTWLCIGEINKPLFFCEYGTWANELVILIILVVVGILTLFALKQFKRFLALWIINWLVVAFLVFSITSFAWSVSTIGTLQRVLQLVLSTILAAYLGFRFSARQILKVLFLFIVLFTIVSYILVAVIPGAGIMTTWPHEGAWRGVLSHRNYLGSFAAYGSVIAVMAFIVERKSTFKRILASLVFIGLIGLILFSKSATGLILMVMLNMVFLAFLGWLYLWPKFTKCVKVGILSGGSILAGAVLLNMERILNLIGRNTSLTGRIPLWKYLIEGLAEHNLWLGYGLGTVWFSKAFRLKTAEDLGWLFQVVNGHNGFIDTLLYLGIIGLILLVALTVYVLFIAGKHFVKEKTELSFFPFISILYVIIANITISFFFEFETFHWCLLIAFLFHLTSQFNVSRKRQQNEVAAG